MATHSPKVRLVTTEGRMPPHDIDAEAALLSACLLDPKRILGATVAATDFYSRSHQCMWGAIQACFERDRHVDVVTAMTECRAQGRHTEVPAGYWTEVLNAAPVITEVAFERYQRTVLERSEDRQLLARLQEATAELYLGEIPDTTTFRGRLASDIEALSRGAEAHDPVSYDAALKAFQERYWKPRARLSFGLAAFDRVIGGLFGGDLTVVAARPGMGKTSLVWQVCMAVGAQGHRALMISCEMSAVDLHGRALSAAARVPFSLVRSGKIDAGHRTRLIEASQRLRDAARLVDVVPLTAPSVELVRSIVVRQKVRAERSGMKLGVVAIDYLQIMQMVDPKNRVSSIQHITANLKALANSLDVPLILLSQLNREVEARTDKRPKLADLRDSGSIEQDADNILMIYRGGYYATPRQTSGPAEIDVAKCRNGDPAVVELEWIGPETRFSEVTQPEE